MKKLVLLAAAATAACLLYFAPAAPAPPAIGVPNVVVTRSCVPWGWPIPVAGSGFSPGTKVTVSAPFGHYVGFTGSAAEIQSVTATADANGLFKTHLRAPKQSGRPGRNGWTYMPRAVFADGTPEAAGAPSESFATVLLARRKMCGTLAAESSGAAGR